MISSVALVFLLGVIANSVEGNTLPFQVNYPPIESCTTKLRIDTDTLTGVKRGDDSFPCTGYLEYSKGSKVRKICGNQRSFNDYAAQRACYTLGVNFYRDKAFSDTTRQMMLYRCFQYNEQGVETTSYADNEIFHDSNGMIHNEYQDTGCMDRTNDPTVFDCFDECHFYGSTLALEEETYCTYNEPFWALGCTDINECMNGVLDNCTGPFETSCQIRKPCGDNAQCTNYPGSFECSCEDGYIEKNGQEFDPYDLYAGCVDIDECAASVCDPNAHCTNTPGSYICTCIDGFSGDGHTCTGTSCGPLPNLPNAVTVSDLFGAYEFGDEVEYTCPQGYKVPVQNVPTGLVNAYGFSERNSFKLTCEESGHWGPNPVPICAPVSCGEPSSLPFSTRLGTGFLFGQEVTYECEDGFKPAGGLPGFTSFKRTCQADGTWTQGDTCKDINECSDGACTDTETCLNSIGSYSCVPNFPAPCTLLGMLNMCDYGTCVLEDSTAKCKCDPGYHGKACDLVDQEEEEEESSEEEEEEEESSEEEEEEEPVVVADQTTQILAIVAISLVIPLMMLALAYCFYQMLRTRWAANTASPSQPSNYGYGMYPPVKPYIGRRNQMF